ncbi:MAG: hypothetical protein E3J66_06535 [Dehalococcoidia bacterium]|nr:MAG: hypothetical protein E3J66_06535 [Dehalococcoidia bacterium]
MRKFVEGSWTNDTVELRLPLKLEYSPILRATTGAVAGVISFNYDEIMQLRVAVSEVFEQAMKYVTPGRGVSEVNELAVRFLGYLDRIEILIAGPKDYTSHLNTQDGKESLALLRTLTDEVKFDAKVAGKSLVRMVKYKSLMEGT